MGLGMSLFLCVFLIPFVAVGTGMVGVALMNLVGKVEVVLDEYNSYAATGIGPLVWKKRFDPLQVHSIDFTSKTWQTEGQANSDRLIELKSDRIIKFGSFLQSDRLEWMCSALKELLLKSNTNRTITDLPVLSWIDRGGK